MYGQKQITPKQAIAGIINGMVGSLALLLPTLSLQSGYIGSYIAIIISGNSCAFASWIYSLHLGQEPDIGLALNRHFKVRIIGKLFYDISVWLFIILLCIEYFEIIVKIWLVVFQYPSEKYMIVSSIINGGVMLAVVLCVKYFQFGAKTMVYGIISIFIYLVFITYSWISQNMEAQEIINYVPIQTGAFSLISYMNQGFIIQTFLFPFLKKLKNQKAQRKNFINYTFISYLIGALVYIYMAIAGSYAIIHRRSDQNPIAYGILAYFTPQWPIKAMAVIYILHIFSVYPQYLLISFQILDQNVEKCGPDEQSFHFRRFRKVLNIIYIPLIIAISASVSAFQISISKLAIVNGAIIGSLITFIIPCILHIYCLFCIPQKRRIPFKSIYQQNKINPKKQQQENKKILDINKAPLLQQDQIDRRNSDQTESSARQKSIKSQNMQNYYVDCNCQHYKHSNIYKVIISLILIVLSIFGVYITTRSIYDSLLI